MTRGHTERDLKKRVYSKHTDSGNSHPLPKSPMSTSDFRHNWISLFSFFKKSRNARVQLTGSEFCALFFPRRKQASLANGGQTLRRRVHLPNQCNPNDASLCLSTGKHSLLHNRQRWTGAIQKPARAGSSLPPFPPSLPSSLPSFLPRFPPLHVTQKPRRTCPARHRQKHRQ